MAQVTVRYWAGARQAAGCATETLDVSTIGDVRAHLAARPAGQAVSVVASFLLDGQAASDETSVAHQSIVDVLPPFAGG